MCNRYVSPEEAEIERFWHIGPRNQPKWPRRAEVFPRAQEPFIRAEKATEGLPATTLQIGQWGLISWFAETPSLTYSTKNARAEGVATKASSKQPWLQGKRWSPISLR